MANKFKLYEIKIPQKHGEKTYWKTIGTIFCDPASKLFGSGGKPASFQLDWPATNGIVVKKLSKEEIAERKANGQKNTDEPADPDSDSSQSESDGDLPI